MVNNREEQLNRIFSALSDPTRRAMLRRLGPNPMSIAELSEPFEISKSAVTKHVKALEKAGLIQRTIDGRIHNCRLQTAPLQAASKWMRFYEKYWNNKLDALDGFLSDATPRKVK